MFLNSGLQQFQYTCSDEHYLSRSERKVWKFQSGTEREPWLLSNTGAVLH